MAYRLACNSPDTIKVSSGRGTALRLRVRNLLCCGAFLAYIPAGAFAQQDSSASRTALLNKYCVACHSAKLRTGGLSLQDADLGNVPAQAETWEKVIRKLRTGSMPPQGLPRPDASSLNDLAAFLENAVDRAAAAKDRKSVV